MSIWKHKEIVTTAGEIKNLITLNEGETPVEKLNYNGSELFLKREDLNPTVSWKDRGTAYKISLLAQNKMTEAVLASSGNAAISFLEYAKKFSGFRLVVVVSNQIDENKLAKIQEKILNTQHELIVANNPRKKATEISAERKIVNLRSSIDNEIVRGYWSLGFELYETIKNNPKEFAIFAPVSSGTAFVGIAEGIFLKTNDEYEMPAIFACQTQSVHPLIQSSFENSEKSIADAIIDKTLLRAPQINKIIANTRGGAFAITNEEILKAEGVLKSLGVSTKFSPTSLLSVAGFLRELPKRKFKKGICIISGI